MHIVDDPRKKLHVLDLHTCVLVDLLVVSYGCVRFFIYLFLTWSRASALYMSCVPEGLDLPVNVETLRWLQCTCHVYIYEYIPVHVLQGNTCTRSSTGSLVAILLAIVMHVHKWWCLLEREYTDMLDLVFQSVLQDCTVSKVYRYNVARASEEGLQIFSIRLSS